MQCDYRILQVVGPMANNPQQLFGDYAAAYASNVTKSPSEGLADVADNVITESGCPETTCFYYNKTALADAVSKADMAVVCLGTGSSSFYNRKESI